MKQLDIKNYQEKVEHRQWDDIRADILSHVMELVRVLFDAKDIDKKEYEEDGEIRYKHIANMFYDDIYTCSSLSYLINDLIPKEGDFIDASTVENWIKRYNENIEELEEYLKYKEIVDKKGRETIHKENLKSVEDLCKEMLDYKNKTYDNNMRLHDLIKKVEVYYAYFTYTLYQLRCALLGLFPHDSIEHDDKGLDTVEKHMIITDICNYLKNYYKEKAFIYRDFDLQDGETLDDIYHKEYIKYRDLYEEMLDFINMPYDKKDPFYKIKDLVFEYYPYYKDIVENVDKDLYDNSRVAILSRMEDAYDMIKANFKNRDKDMKKYISHIKEEEKTIQKSIEEDDDIEDLLINDNEEE